MSLADLPTSATLWRGMVPNTRRNDALYARAPRSYIWMHGDTLTVADGPPDDVGSVADSWGMIPHGPASPYGSQ